MKIQVFDDAGNLILNWNPEGTTTPIRRNCYPVTDPRIGQEASAPTAKPGGVFANIHSEDDYRQALDKTLHTEHAGPSQPTKRAGTNFE